MENKKWYGLTLPKKAAKLNTKGKSIFESDDSDENIKDHTKIKKESSTPPELKKKRPPEPKPDELESNIYEYDSIYDEMKASLKQKTLHTKSKEPRYINLLLKAAEKRKKESERRVERKIQAERVKEGDVFKDKEAFVTSAYRQKMIEREEEEEREQQENALEEMMDSTKQKDLSGFYRHFLKQTIGEEKVPTFGERDGKISGADKKKQDYVEIDKSRPKDELPCSSRNAKIYSSCVDKDGHCDTKWKAGKSRNDSSYKSEIKENKHGELSKFGNSKDKPSSQRSRSRLRNNSPSHSAGHSKNTWKQTSPSEKHNNAQSSSSDLCMQRSKYDKEKQRKKDTKTSGKTEKVSLQTSPKSTTDDDRYQNDNRSSISKSVVDDATRSGHSSDDGSISKVRKHSRNSPKRESKNNDDYSENKRRKFHDDADTSNSSSGEDEVNAEENQKKESKGISEKPKSDMATKFAKRTVGKIFDEAQTRYFKRRDATKAMS